MLDWNQIYRCDLLPFLLFILYKHKHQIIRVYQEKKMIHRHHKKNNMHQEKVEFADTTNN